MNTSNLIQAIKSDNSAEIKSNFEAVLANKVANKIETMKAAVGKEMFNFDNSEE